MVSPVVIDVFNSLTFCCKHRLRLFMHIQKSSNSAEATYSYVQKTTLIPVYRARP